MNIPAARGTEKDHTRRQLIGLALLFFAPLGLAFFFYYGSVGWRPSGRVNHGRLIDPPRPLPALILPLVTGGGADVKAGGAPLEPTAAPRVTRPDFLTRKWTLLYWGAGACPERCRRNLYGTRQVRTALDRDMGRVQRVFIAEGGCCDLNYLRSEQADLITIRATPEALPLRALLPGAENSASAAADRVYLIDPLGNLMMSYAWDADPKGMLEDLRRLLDLSQVG